MGDWTTDELERLKRLYKETGIPSDELVKDTVALDRFTTDFRSRLKSAGLDRDIQTKEIADQLFRLRKTGKLPRIRD
jgi:hypothetical protein